MIVMVIIGNELNNPSSNPGCCFLHFPLRKVYIQILSSSWWIVGQTGSLTLVQQPVLEKENSTLDGTPLKLVDKFTYLGSSIASTEKDINTRLMKAWTAINRLSIIWKSDLTDKMKRSFFQAAVASILLFGCTTWTLTKRLEKKLDGNYTRILEQDLAATPHKTPTVRPPASYHEDYSS